MKFPVFGIVASCVGLAFPSAAACADEWPAAMLEIEQLAVKDPRPGSALWHLRQLAIESGRLAEWRARWELRVSDSAGAAESVLLGWLALDAGNAKEARARFARAAAVPGAGPQALLALAESQLRAGEAGGEGNARRAAEAFTRAEEIAEALRLPAIIAQSKGETAAAWKNLAKLEGDTLAPAVRLALIPDFARAHLATGGTEKWAGALALAAGKGADDAAAYAVACMALGDPALAHRVAVDALKREPAHAGLLRLATAAARAAGFASDAAARTEAALGDEPTDDELIEALHVFANLDAPDHARRVFERHAARLAPVASRWRQTSPKFWRHGITAGLRRTFAPHAAAGGWELQLTLGELAILENDFAAAQEPLWRMFAREFDGGETASTVRAAGNRRAAGASPFPMAGLGLAMRLGEIEGQIREQQIVFQPTGDSATSWSVNSLTDARDVTLSYLHRLAKMAGGDAPEKFLATLRERTAHWLPEERLLAFAAIGNPGGMLDAAAAVLERPKLSVALENFVRNQLARVRALPGLQGDFLARADALAAKLPPEEVIPRRAPSTGQRWVSLLQKSWLLFDEEKFAEADAKFVEVLRVLGEEGMGPDPAGWANFHASTINSMGSLADPKAKATAAAYALKWIGLQGVRRTDCPARPRPQAVLEEAVQPRSVSFMFVSSRHAGAIFYTPMGESYFASPGGSIPPEILPKLFYFAIEFRGADRAVFGETLAAQLRDIPADCARLAWLCEIIASRFAGSATAVPVPPAAWRDSADAAVARLIAARTTLAMRNREPGRVAPETVADFAKDIPAGPVGRAAWLAAQLHLIARLEVADDPVPVAEELLKLSFDAATFTVAKNALDLLAARNTRADSGALRAMAGKITVARLRMNGGEPLAGEIEERLRLLTDAAEVDEATALARRILSWPSERVARSPKSAAARRQALVTLNTCGELHSWFADLRKAAKPDDALHTRKLAEISALILDVVPKNERRPEIIRDGRHLTPAPKGGLDAALRRDARESQRDAWLKLVRLEPEVAAHWAALQQSRERDTDATADERKPPVIETETLVRGAAGGLSADVAATYSGGDLDRLAELTAKWTVRPVENGQIHGPGIAVQLWRGGRRDEAVAWLWKLFRADPGTSYQSPALRTMLIEALALRGDTAAILDVLESTLVATAKPAAPMDAFPRRDYSGSYPSSARAIRPLLDQASALGLADALRAKLEKGGAPGSQDPARLLRVQMRDAAVLPEIVARIAKPVPPLFLEELAALLDGWSEGRAASRAALLRLEAAHALQTPGERVEQLALHGWLAARCGMEREATRWLLDAFVLQGKVRCNQPAVLLHVTEGLLLCPLANNANDAAMELAKLMKPPVANMPHFASEPVVKRIRELAAEGNGKAVNLFSAALQVSGAAAEQAIATAIEDAARMLDLHSGKTTGLSPVASVGRTSDDGTSEIVWTHAALPPGDKERRQMRVAEMPRTTPPWRGRIELFFGETAGRLESIAVIENAEVNGAWRGILPKPDGWLAISAGAGGRTVLGPATPVHFGKNLLPGADEILAKILPAPIWRKLDGGPGGEAFESVLAAERTFSGGNSVGNFVVPIADAPGKDLTLSGWVKRGQIMFTLLGEDGQSQDIGSQAIGGPQGDWQHFEMMFPVAELAPRQPAGRMKVRGIAVKLSPGAAYSGLRVIATEPKSREKN